MAILVSNLLRFKARDDLHEGRIESVWIELFPGSKKRSMLLCCTYKSPSTASCEFYDNLLSECDKGLISKSQNLTILGDLNSDLLDPDLPQTKLLNSFCNHLDLSHLVTSATRVTSESTSLLDVIITNNESCYRDTSVSPFSGSDHHIVATCFVARGIKAGRPHKYVKCRSYRNLDVEMVQKALDADIWGSVLSIDDLDDCVNCLNRVLVGFLEMLCPSKWRRVSAECPQWSQTPEIRRVRKLRECLHRRALRENSTALWAEYRKIRNRATSMIRASKSRYISDIAKDLKNKSSEFWKRMSHLGGKVKSKIGPVMPGTADEFNDHFLSIAHKTIANVPACNISPASYLHQFSNVPSFSLSSVTEEEVYHAMKGLNVRKATRR